MKLETIEQAMKIKSIKQELTHIIEVEGSDFPIFKREGNPPTWYNHMGNTWEWCDGDSDEMEKLFQESTLKESFITQASVIIKAE